MLSDHVNRPWVPPADNSAAHSDYIRLACLGQRKPNDRVAACRTKDLEPACGAKSQVSADVREAYSLAETAVLSDRLLRKTSEVAGDRFDLSTKGF